MASGRYWEMETPKVVRTEGNEFRYYEQAQKLQVYPVIQNTAHGVGRGATIDLAVMGDTEKRTVGELFGLALGAQAGVL